MNGIYDEVRIALHAIWTRRWLALAVAWGVCVLGWLVVSQIPSRYESTSRVFVQMQTILPAGMDGVPQSTPMTVDTIRTTLISAVNLEKVVRGTDLAATISSDRDVADRERAPAAAMRGVEELVLILRHRAGADADRVAQPGRGVHLEPEIVVAAIARRGLDAGRLQRALADQVDAARRIARAGEQPCRAAQHLQPIVEEQVGHHAGKAKRLRRRAVD